MQGGEKGVKGLITRRISWVSLVLPCRKAKLWTKFCKIRIAGHRTGVAVQLLQLNHLQSKSLMESREIQTWVLVNFVCL